MDCITHIIEKLVYEVILQNKIHFCNSAKFTVIAMYLKSVFRNLARSIARKCLVKQEILKKVYPKNLIWFWKWFWKEKKYIPEKVSFLWLAIQAKRSPIRYKVPSYFLCFTWFTCNKIFSTERLILGLFWNFLKCTAIRRNLFTFFFFSFPRIEKELLNLTIFVQKCQINLLHKFKNLAL